MSLQKKILFFGLSTETKQLLDWCVKNQFYALGVFENREHDFVNGTILEGVTLIKKKQVDKVVCCGSKVSFSTIEKIVQLCFAQQIDCYIIPNPNFTLSQDYKKETFGILELYKSKKDFHLGASNRFIKRLFDIFFSIGVILFVLSWFFPIIAIWIKLSSKGPIIFKQKRNGKDNRVFVCYKFRTMRLNTESDTLQAKESDNRITKIGAFLRKTSLDELPQFFNVLKGDMSVVGPRPHMIKHNEDYSKLIENYNYRTKVKPGITGLSQVLGYRGETESDIYLMKIRVRIDRFYIKNWSFKLDIKIIFQTIFRVLKPTKNTF